MTRLPESGVSSPASILSSVDLPAPFRPERVIRSRSSSLKETSPKRSRPPTCMSRDVAVAIAIEPLNLSKPAAYPLRVDREQLRAVQAPLKERYEAEPGAALVTLSAEGTLGEGVS